MVAFSFVNSSPSYLCVPILVQSKLSLFYFLAGVIEKSFARKARSNSKINWNRSKLMQTVTSSYMSLNTQPWNFIMDSSKKKVMSILWPNTVKIVLEVHVCDCFSIFQKSCNNAEDECLHYKSLYERSQQELKDLAEKHKQVLKMSFGQSKFQ